MIYDFASTPCYAIFRRWRNGSRSATKAIMRFWSFGTNKVGEEKAVQRGACSKGRRSRGPKSPQTKKERTQTTVWWSEFFWLRRWDLNLTTFGLWARRAARLLHSAIYGAGSRGRTGTRNKSHGILSPGRLPIPPFRHVTTKRSSTLLIYYIIKKIKSQYFFKNSFYSYWQFKKNVLLYISSSLLFPLYYMRLL